MRYLRILALVALCLAYAPTPALAVTGYDSAYSGESAFVTISPGQTQSFQVFFSNTGTLTWTKGGSTQVDLAACLADKVTCPAQDPADSTWNSGWISSTRYATTTQATVAPGEMATFTYNIKAPADATAGVHRFNGDLVVASSGARIHPEGYYQDAEVQATGSVPVPTPTPTPGSTPFPSPPPPTAPAATPTPTPTPRLNFTLDTWAYACGVTAHGNPVTKEDVPDTGNCPSTDEPGSATASFTQGALTLTKTGPTTDDLAAGAFVNGLTTLTSASYDVTGYCGGGSPGVRVFTTDGQAHFYSCNTRASGGSAGGHVTIDFTDPTQDGAGNGGVAGKTVDFMYFIQDEMGGSTITNIMFNGMSQ
jgi:hypothetical protein